MSDTDVVSDYQLPDADKNIQVTDGYVIVDPTLLRVNYAQANTNAFANSITKKPAIEWALEKAGEQRNTPEHRQPEFAGSIHLAG
jgi:hypothetical protein